MAAYMIQSQPIDVRKLFTQKMDSESMRMLLLLMRQHPRINWNNKLRQELHNTQPHTHNISAKWQFNKKQEVNSKYRW